MTPGPSRQAASAPLLAIPTDDAEADRWSTHLSAEDRRDIETTVARHLPADGDCPAHRAPGPGNPTWPHGHDWTGTLDTETERCSYCRQTRLAAIT